MLILNGMKMQQVWMEKTNTSSIRNTLPWVMIIHEQFVLVKGGTKAKHYTQLCHFYYNDCWSSIPQHRAVVSYEGRLQGRLQGMSSSRSGVKALVWLLVQCCMFYCKCDDDLSQSCWSSSVVCTGSIAQDRCLHGNITVVRVQEETLIAGRLEICVAGEWRAVCEYQWTLEDAKVVCQYFGFPGSGIQTIHTAVTTCTLVITTSS